MRETTEEVEYRFECFLSECDLKFSSKSTLRNHLIDGHHLEVIKDLILNNYKMLNISIEF